MWPGALIFWTATLAVSSVVMTTATVFINLKVSEITRMQFYQGGYSTRIGVTSIWKESYTADTRNRVSKFAVNYARWQRESAEAAEESVDILADQKRVFDGRTIRNDKNILRLLYPDLEGKWRTIRSEGKRRALKGEEEEEWADMSDGDLVEAALKYRNAIIECLNALEAIQAIMKARPSGFNEEMPDLLEARYKDLIIDLTGKLLPFICRYNLANPRETPPWHILTDKTACPKAPPKVLSVFNPASDRPPV